MVISGKEIRNIVDYLKVTFEMDQSISKLISKAGKETRNKLIYNSVEDFLSETYDEYLQKRSPENKRYILKSLSEDFYFLKKILKKFSREGIQIIVEKGS
jgi:hypothetical protein